MSTFLLIIAIVNAVVSWINYRHAKKNSAIATSNMAHAAFLVMINQRLQQVADEIRDESERLNEVSQK